MNIINLIISQSTMLGWLIAIGALFLVFFIDDHLPARPKPKPMSRLRKWSIYAGMWGVAVVGMLTIH